MSAEGTTDHATDIEMEDETDKFFAQPLKHQFIAALGNLPDDATLDDAIECLIVIHKIGIGIAQANAGMLIPHDEVMKQIRLWAK